jgi:1-acyl-sn-glycerol-3-phosphate acyltransferase
MQFFKFIFLERSWAADRLNLTSRLSAIAAHHMITTTERAEDDEPLALIIFPEGTLFSGDTVPVSQKYAEKMGLVCAASHLCQAAY